VVLLVVVCEPFAVWWRGRTRVSSSQVMPFCLLASVYEKPSTWPVLRPKRPCRLGPILLPSPSFRVWHCAHRVWWALGQSSRFAAEAMRKFAFVAGQSYLEEVGTLLSVTC
jgi:hypothetical protein